MKPTYRHLLRYALLLFILADLGYSFWQYLQFPIDEDLARIVVPDRYYQTVLEDPLGLAVWKAGEAYQATNRFVAHYSIWGYFRVVPRALQHLLSPIDSLYWSAALFKLLVQLLLLSQLSRYALSIVKARPLEKLAGLALFLPFFQTMGYQHVFGMIDASITYTFFYAWPLALLLVFYWPFYQRWVGLPSRRMHPLRFLFSLGLAFLLPFSSPLAAPLILLIAVLYFFAQGRFLAAYGFRQKAGMELLTKERGTLFIFVFASATALYAYVLGTYNTENFTTEMLDLSQRYTLMVQGFWRHFTAKLAYPLLIAFLVLNTLILRSRPMDYSLSILKKIAPYFVVGILLYLILLPLGGYRLYRPEIVRRDTLLPVLISLLLWLGWTSILVARVLKAGRRSLYLSVFIGMLLAFTLADGPNAGKNRCERRGLRLLAEAKESPYTLPLDCPVLAWAPYDEASHSKWNAYFLYQLGITEQIILYQNQE
ncbi:MAG TPA: hypothetical protein VJ953_18960 [Saprospiraceae bacterium]|nr:hypothetical protein [Saprospiraceae bacterium]